MSVNDPTFTVWLKKKNLVMLIGKWLTIWGCKSDYSALAKLCDSEVLEIKIFSFRFILYMSNDIHPLHYGLE